MDAIDEENLARLGAHTCEHCQRIVLDFRLEGGDQLNDNATSSVVRQFLAWKLGPCSAKFISDVLIELKKIGIILFEMAVEEMTAAASLGCSFCAWLSHLARFDDSVNNSQGLSGDWLQEHRGFVLGTVLAAQLRDDRITFGSLHHWNRAAENAREAAQRPTFFGCRPGKDSCVFMAKRGRFSDSDDLASRIRSMKVTDADHQRERLYKKPARNS